MWNSGSTAAGKRLSVSRCAEAHPTAVYDWVMAAWGILDSPSDIYSVHTRAAGPAGSLPLTEEMLRNWSSGDLLGLSQDAGMGWEASQLGKKEFLILSTSGGLRADDGTPIALGYHTGHWEVGLLMQAAAREFKNRGAIPFAAFCTDPCDGRTQGTK